MKEWQRVSRTARLWGEPLVHETITNCMDEKNHTDWETKGSIFRYEIKKKETLCHYPPPTTPPQPLHLKYDFKNNIAEGTVLSLGQIYLS